MNLPSTLATMAAASMLGIVDYRLLVVATAVIVAAMALVARRRDRPRMPREPDG